MALIVDVNASLASSFACSHAARRFVSGCEAQKGSRHSHLHMWLSASFNRGDEQIREGCMRWDMRLVPTQGARAANGSFEFSLGHAAIADRCDGGADVSTTAARLR
eukprot:3407917-Pleurochrysis_carterae.AAC.3